MAKRYKVTTGARSRPWNAERLAWISLLIGIALVPVASGVLLGRDWALSMNIDATPKLVALTLPLLAATVLWAVSLAEGRSLRWSPFATLLAVFATLVTLSTAMAPLPLTSLFGLTGLLTGAITWLSSLWLGFLILQLVDSRERMRTLSLVFFTSTAIVALIGTMQVAEIDPLGIRMSYDYAWMLKQGMSTMGNPNYTGVLVLAPLSLAITFAVSTPKGWLRYLFAAAALMMGVLVFGTLARAAWLGAVIVAGLWMLTLRRPGAGRGRRSALIGSAAIVLVVAIGIAFSTPVYAFHRFEELFSSFAVWANGRVELWMDGLRAIAERPLTGSGAELLSQVGYRVQETPFIEAGQRFMMQDPHSLPLQIAALFGIPALVVFAMLIVFALRGSGQRVQGAAEGGVSALYTGWLIGFVGLAVAMLFSVTSITVPFLVFTTLGILAAPGAKPVAGRDALKWVAATIGVALMMVASFGAVRTYAASRAVIASQTQGSEAQMLRALELAPWDHVLRRLYLDQKIGFEWPMVTGSDTAASAAALTRLDAHVRTAIMDFPEELTLYTLLIDLHANAKDAPGYDRAKHAAAVDLAVKRFPNDPEVQRRAQELASSE